MKTQLLKALSLPDILYVTGIEDDEKEIRVSCSLKKHAVPCIHCGGRTVKFGKASNRKRHTFFGAKPVFLCIAKSRLRCKECRRVFAEQIEGMEEQRATDHFNQLVQEKSRNQDFSSVARELGISPATVMRKQDLLSLERFNVPDYEEIHLGLDGKYLNGDTEIFVMGDVKKKDFFGVTQTNSAADLKKVLQKNLLDNGKTVKVASIDMSKQLKSVIDSLFPDAILVIDKFHVIKYVNAVIDLCRIAVEKSNNERFGIKRLLLMKVETLEKICNKPKWKHKVKQFEKILKDHPDIQVLWDLKNRLHVFYQSKERKEAEERFKGIIGYLDSYKKEHPEFADLKKTLLNWQPYILNHFDTGITNAYIEGLNNRIETLKRKRFGFRDTKRFLKCVVFALLPLCFFIQNPLFNNYL
jgi:transposase